MTVIAATGTTTMTGAAVTGMIMTTAVATRTIGDGTGTIIMIATAIATGSATGSGRRSVNAIGSATETEIVATGSAMPTVAATI
jgi:hypothetical protein